MIKESYDYIAFENKTYFYFESTGNQGIIRKVIVFTHREKNLWNLAFGDLGKGEIDDSIVSNNHDIVKIISTIAKVVYEFSDKFPSREIFIHPVDEKRKKLYNHVFRRNYEAINLKFHIIGTVNNKEEDYSTEKFYDIFKLKRKFVQ